MRPKKAYKWDPWTKKYTPIELDPKCTIFVRNLEQVVKCAGCGKELAFGATYTSKIIHTQFGMGYGVCSKCYEKEVQQEMEVLQAEGRI